MKKIKMLAVLSFISLLLVGCGQTTNNNTANESGSTTSEKSLNQTENVSEDVELYSDDTKLVFNFYDTYKIVYYYSGNTITGLEWYYTYDSVEVATVSLAAINANLTSDDQVESVTQNGRHIIVKMKPAAYEGMTTEEVKSTYSYLEQVYKGQ
ncbi:MAG: hypothetical protein Q4G04_05850 [bacterium]|nr:hypothetical protein [bacterium]